MVFALFVFFNSRTCTNFTLWMANVCVFSLEPFSQNTLCQPQSAYLHAVGSLILWRHSPWILVNCALRRLARLPKVCFFFFLFFFLTIETFPRNDEVKREKTLPVQYKLSIPKEKMKREMKSFHGVAN